MKEEYKCRCVNKNIVSVKRNIEAAKPIFQFENGEYINSGFIFCCYISLGVQEVLLQRRHFGSAANRTRKTSANFWEYSAAAASARRRY